MALPLLLIDDAVHAIALLGGRDGLKLDQLFPRLPRLPKADDACKAFIWRKLCSHPELSLSCEGRTKAQILALNVADAGDVLLIASERLRAHLCGVREETDARGHATFKSKEAESVMSVASRHGVTGVLQNALTKLVGVAANKLAYTLFVLEIDRLLHRQAVYRRTVETGGRGKKRASPGAAGSTTGSGGGTVADPTDVAGASLQMRTNLVTIPAIAAPRVPAAALSDYAARSSGEGGEGGEGEGPNASLLSQMVDVLGRAPFGLMPVYRLRIALGLQGKGKPQVAWALLKNHAVGVVRPFPSSRHRPSPLHARCHSHTSSPLPLVCFPFHPP